MKIQNVHSNNYKQQTFGSGFYRPSKDALIDLCGPAIATHIESISLSLEKLAKTPIEGLPEGVAVVLRPERDPSALGVIVRDDFLNSEAYKASFAKIPEEVQAAQTATPFEQMVADNHFPKEREYGRMYLGQYFFNPTEFGKDLVRTVTTYIKLYGKRIQRQAKPVGKKD